MLKIHGLNLQETPPSLEALGKAGINIIFRDIKDSKIKKYTWLFDCGNEDLITKSNSAVVPDGNDWYIVGPSESAIFLDARTSTLLFSI